MPPFPFPDDDIKAIAEYLHSVLKQAGRQGRPPVDETVPPEKVLVGDANAGQAFFNAKCGSCHSTTGDLQRLASRVANEHSSVCLYSRSNRRASPTGQRMAQRARRRS